jgi:hypothetical protein
VGFEPTIPASERAKTVHALDSSATVTGTTEIYTAAILLLIMYRNKMFWEEIIANFLFTLI